MAKLNTIDVKGEIEKRLKDPAFLREWVDAQVEEAVAEIFRGHAAVWGREAEAIGECMVSLRNDVDLVPYQLMMELCTSIAERYEAKASNPAKESEG